MYLSHLLINVGTNPDRPRPGRVWLRNRYRVHQRLCMAFPSDGRKADDPHFLKPYVANDFAGTDVHVVRNADAGFLYRVDILPSGRVVILVQSPREPDWGYAFHNADYLLAAAPEVRPYRAKWAAGQTARFRLQANVTRKVRTKTGEDGKRKNGARVPVERERLVEWLQRKGQDSGFFVSEPAVHCQTGYVYFHKDSTEDGRLFSVVYDGVLTIADGAAFAGAITTGIGPAKAFGFGLLTAVALQE